MGVMLREGKGREGIPSFNLCCLSFLFCLSSLLTNLHPITYHSYMYMENVINHWDQMGVLQKCMEHKLVYLETKDVVETTLALDNYKKACDSGRGAVFLSIARGKVAEGIDFDNHYGRCVVLFGIPYQYTKSHVLRARLDYMREKYQVCPQFTFSYSSHSKNHFSAIGQFLHP